MGVAPVGDTKISADNAKEIYTKWKKGEVELSASQQKYTESFLSPEEIDQIEYDTGSNIKDATQKGKDQIDTTGTDKKALGGAIASTVGSVASAVAVAMSTGIIGVAGDGFSAAAAGGVAAGAGAAAIACAYCLDVAYKDRTKANSNKDQTNAVIDGYSNALIDTMDMMNSDMEEYQAQQEELTLTVNENTSQSAVLAIQIADMEAAGDIEGAQQAKEQLKALQEMDTSSQEEGLEETKGRLEEYNAANAESEGVKSSGQSVSDFLKEGTTLGILGTISSVALGAATIVLGLVISVPKLAPFFPDIAGSTLANILFKTAAALFGYATKEMITRTVEEYKCGSSGQDMQGHVNGLGDMQTQQSAYVDTTEESFTASDEEAAESQAEAQEAADEAEAKADQNRKAGGATDDDKDDKDKNKGSNSGTGTGSGTNTPSGAAA